MTGGASSSLGSNEAQGATDRTAGRYAIQAAVKTLEVLFAFRRARGPLTLTKVCRHVELGRNQVYRCLKSLEAAGLVAEVDEGFVLTPKVMELVPPIRRQTLYPAAESTLRMLRERTGESVDLLVTVSGCEAVCVITFVTLHAIGVRSEIGQRSLLHAGAAPKAILAFMERDAREQVLRNLPNLPRHTLRTQTDARLLRRELEQIRHLGYAVSDGDYEDGERGVGAPILDGGGRPLGGLSVRGPAERMSYAALRGIGELAAEAGREISRRVTERGVVWRQAAPTGGLIETEGD